MFSAPDFDALCSRPAPADRIVLSTTRIVLTVGDRLDAARTPAVTVTDADGELVPAVPLSVTLHDPSARLVWGPGQAWRAQATGTATLRVRGLCEAHVDLSADAAIEIRARAET